MIIKLKRKFYSKKPQLVDFVDINPKESLSDYGSIYGSGGNDGWADTFRRSKEHDELTLKKNKKILKKHLYDLNKDMDAATKDSIDETRHSGKIEGGIFGGIGAGILGAGIGCEFARRKPLGMAVGGLAGAGLGALGGSKLMASVNEREMKYLIDEVLKNQKRRENDEKQRGTLSKEDLAKIKELKKMGLL